MGVHGLWKLIEPSGQIVPLESLAGKILAVDISIWLHQAVKGMHDAHGAPVAVAHLLILFHRLCKLLFYKIKPVFVFDGGVPLLKSQTMRPLPAELAQITFREMAASGWHRQRQLHEEVCRCDAARRQRSSIAKSEALKVREKLIKNLLKHEAIRQVLSDQTASAVLGLNSFTLPGPSVEEDLYKLPPIASDYVDSESSEAATSSGEESDKPSEDIHSVDVTSQDFLNLPAEVRHDILTELIETRKQSSWKSLDSMPKQSDSFSDFQMNRLLKRHAVQTSLEKAGKEMGGRGLSLKELESLLGDQGVLDPKMDLPSRRIAQDSTTRYMLVQRESEVTKEGFDIMEHLEEVEWSSESDTDVILEQRKSRESPPTTPKNQPEKDESHSVCRPAKVRIAEEMADILSVLEDKDAMTEVKVKVENLQSRINLNINSKETESERGVTGNSATITKATESAVCVKAKPFPLITESSEPSSMSALAEVSRSVDKAIEKVEEKVEAINERQRGSAAEPYSVNVDDIKEIADSSSDSESDFIPITEEEMESMVPQTETTQQDAPPSVSAPGSDSLTVVINPSESSDKDDLFADVFDPQASGQGAACKPASEEQVSAEDISEALEKEHLHLMKERGRQERHALNLTDQIYTDAQELLRLFGIPFVVAPMEAEAQCATLDLMGLTEGTITDDSDIWLFGGRVVYKNFFNQSKHVLEYRSENIEKNFKLTREEMIKMALLVGSDYTAGLSGIGPVTALEIIASFQTPNRGALEGLAKFRDWFTGASKGGPPRAALRKKIRNAVLTPGFPSRAVVEAYLHPQIDDSKEPFSWAKPNLDLIHKYVRAKMGWSTEKCNDLLLPVLRKLEERTNQTTIEKHFRFAQKSAVTDGMLSKRVENAVKRLGNSSSMELDESTYDAKPRKKRKGNREGHGGEPSAEENSKSVKEATTSDSKGPASDAEAKLRLIKAKLHRNTKVPQREMAHKMLEEKKKEAIRIFRTYGKAGKKKTKVFAKEEANLSESSSEND